MDFLENCKNDIIGSVEEYVNGYYDLKKELNNTESELRKYPRATKGLPRDKINKIIALRDKQKSLTDDFTRYKSREGGAFVAKLDAINLEAQRYIESAFAVDVSKMDNPTLELLQSGVCKPSEYGAFMEKAIGDNNSTMIRLIAKCAAEESKKYESMDTVLARRYARIASYAQYADGSAYSNNFKTLVDAAKRVATNPALYRNVGFYDGINSYNAGKL